ncbi:MAG TPA: RimK family protein [Planctomycetota bacterium]|nr:RimK family protein [Planctomycetota bacterium]
MSILIVVNNPDRWPLRIPGVDLVGARSYLTDGSYSERRGVTVFNLCRSYGYQSLGYYVSLLAEARGHRPQPSIATIQDMKLQAVVRIRSEDLGDLMQRSLAPIQSGEFVLSIYFGRSIAQRYRRLALQLFNQFQAPLLRARFQRGEEGWQLQSIGPIPANDIPDSHKEFIAQAAGEYFANRRFSPRRRQEARYDLAILVDPDEAHPPSDARALQRFVRAADAVGLGTELITKDDYGRIAEFDALFIRRTTAVNHYTYSFARRAAAAGLVVIDDPQSIVRCANKVYLHELLERHEVRIPKTVVVHSHNVHQVAAELGLPCVLKQPDSSFSQGVSKVTDRAQLEAELERLLEQSELVIAQEYVPTEFDWRVGVFDRKPLYACRYYMARHHWQIIRHAAGRSTSGKVDALPLELVPRRIIRTAVRAANLIGDGLDGVDVKQSGRRSDVIEVNDNPNIDAGYEDKVLGQELYRRIMSTFLERIERKKSRDGAAGRA